MERFRPDGHLTDEALAALVDQEAMDDLARLEIAEHLAYCDLCLQRYADALAGAPLLAPSPRMQKGLWSRIRQRAIRMFTSRYATAAAAVAIALTMVWGGGDILRSLPTLPEAPEDRPSVSERFSDWSRALNQSLYETISGWNDFFDDLGRGLSRSDGGNGK